VINQQGQVIGHPTAEYVGSSLREDAMVQNLMNSQVGTGSGYFDTLEGAVYGQYEQVGSTNLYVTLTVPSDVFYKNKKVILFQLLLIGLGVSLFAFAGYLFLDKNTPVQAGVQASGGVQAQASIQTNVNEASKQSILNSQNSLEPSLTNKEIPNAKDMLGSKEINSAKDGLKENQNLNSKEIAYDKQKEKMNIYSKVASGISHELRTPLMVILGQVKLLKSAQSSQSAPSSLENAGVANPINNNEVVEKIESEARLAAELIQKLVAFSGDLPVLLEETSVKAVDISARDNDCGFSVIHDRVLVPVNGTD
jgi:signal transduction histidine kinase